MTRSLLVRPVYGLLVLLIITVAGRLIVAAGSDRRLIADPDGYGRLAVNLVTHRQFALYPGAPTSYRPPLYPLLLTCAVQGNQIEPWRLVALHTLLATATIFIVYILSRRWAGGRVRATIAAGWLAVNPLLVYQSTHIMTETLAVFLVVATGWTAERLLERKSWIEAVGCGLLFAGCALCRPVFFVWFIAFAATGWYSLARRNPARAAALWVAMFLAFSAACLPWWVRNYRIWGTLVVATTHGGYTLWLANNEDFYAYLSDKRHKKPWSAARFDDQYARLAQRAAYNEPVVDRQATSRAWQTMRTYPWLAVRAAIYRWSELWNPQPRSTDQRPVSRPVVGLVLLYYLLEYLAALLGMCRLVVRRKCPQWWIWASLVMALHFVHAVYWANARMRAPLEPLLALLAVQAWPERTGQRTGSSLPNA